MDRSLWREISDLINGSVRNSIPIDFVKLESLCKDFCNPDNVICEPLWLEVSEDDSERVLRLFVVCGIFSPTAAMHEILVIADEPVGARLADLFIIAAEYVTDADNIRQEYAWLVRCALRMSEWVDELVKAKSLYTSCGMTRERFVELGTEVGIDNFDSKVPHVMVKGARARGVEN